MAGPKSQKPGGSSSGANSQDRFRSNKKKKNNVASEVGARGGSSTRGGAGGGGRGGRGGRQQGGGAGRPQQGGRPNRNKQRGGSNPSTTVVRKLGPINWAALNLEPINHNTYTQDPQITAATPEQVSAYLKSVNMALTPGAPRPVGTFDQIANQIPAHILQNMLKAGFQNPTPIQSAAWPTCLSGKDMVGVAQTGSGKTMSFLLPLCCHILRQRKIGRGEGPMGLIVTPTRELALQIVDVFNNFCAILGAQPLRCGVAYGGAKPGPQLKVITAGIELLVATPGRLIDYLQSNHVSLSRCSFFILDEADQLLNMGFQKPILQIASQIRPDRQTLFFSATWPAEIRKFASQFLKNPVRVSIGNVETLNTVESVTQNVIVVDSGKEQATVLSLLGDLARQRGNTTDRIILFANQKHKCNKVMKAINNENFGWSAVTIHGNRSQKQRELALASFKQGKCPILVATDVAARGLDIPKVEMVINMHFPTEKESYIHRIGRTGRAGAKGDSYTIFAPDTRLGDSRNRQRARDYIQILRNSVTKPIIPAALYRSAGMSPSR